MAEPAPLHSDLSGAPAGGTATFHRTSDGIRVRIATWSGGTRGTALILPGRTEYIEKYAQVIAHLIGMGFSVACIDWRGQGLSTRINDTTELGHVKHFWEYQHDVASLLSAVADMPRPLHMFAHSMGGAIGLRALIEGLPAASASFSAPMWGLHLPALQGFFAPFILRTLRIFGQGENFAPGARGAEHVALRGYKGNPLTTDPEQYRRMQMLIEEIPDLALGPPSVGWLAAAFDEMDALFDTDLPELPILAGCGTGDTVVSYSAVVSQLERMRRATFVNVEGAKHELWMERPELRDPFWDAISRHIAKVEATL
ncbi:alpha/beta fold hydrolase [Pontivivens nitratireducens]|uniref:alpha/beta fold hydrolase n=1 Tax=Pontivivens nitratireducens TaxID=2758038 RepID=UPI001639AA0D|nr:alpha/beta hydrolase [Pontibrevibacter nitratireducens]